VGLWNVGAAEDRIAPPEGEANPYKESYAGTGAQKRTGKGGSLGKVVGIAAPPVGRAGLSGKEEGEGRENSALISSGVGTRRSSGQLGELGEKFPQSAHFPRKRTNQSTGIFRLRTDERKTGIPSVVQHRLSAASLGFDKKINR